jgi:sugar phosphate isomerase/epimerase
LIATVCAGAAVCGKCRLRRNWSIQGMSEKFGRLALHMWTIDTTPLATALDAARKAGYDAVELRRTDFKRCFDAGMTNAQVLELVRKSGIPVGVLGVEYGWLFATGEESKRLFKVFRESCENAVVLGCDMLMSAPGQVNGTIADAIKYLREAGDIAAEYGLRLAIEFNSQHDVLNKLSVLRELLEGANKPNCGYLIDAYHFTRSGAGGRGFEDVPADRIFCFQYSDLSPHPVTGVRRPTDRLPPGKGVVKWHEIFGLLAEKSYTGYLSYEAPNPDQWARSPYDVAREGVELTRQLLRDAVPGYAS